MADSIYRKFINNPNVIYKKSDIKKATGLNLRSAEWAVLTQVDGRHSVQEIAETLAMDVKDTTKVLYVLFQQGLVDVFQTEKKTENVVSDKFFADLEHILVMIIGPVAPFVLEDALLEMNISKQKFPADRVAELIEMISEEINDEYKKIQFQAEMLELIKKEKS